MRYLAIVGLLALLAVPAWAAESAVTINVASYCGVTVAPGGLTLAVNSVWAPGVNQVAETPFVVEGNTGYYLRVTANETSPSTSIVAGQAGVVGDPFPTARLGGVSTAAGIGYGVSLVGGLSAGWGNSPANDFTKIQIPVTAGYKAANLRINSYLDSGRSTIVGYNGQLAPPGTYTGTLTLTVALTP